MVGRRAIMQGGIASAIAACIPSISIASTSKMQKAWLVYQVRISPVTAKTNTNGIVSMTASIDRNYFLMRNKRKFMDIVEPNLQEHDFFLEIEIPNTGDYKTIKLNSLEDLVKIQKPITSKYMAI